VAKGEGIRRRDISCYRAVSEDRDLRTDLATSSGRSLIASNIAEGQGRLTRGEFCHFLGQARGSLLEVETQLAIALELHFLGDSDFRRLEGLSLEFQKLLNGLIGSMRLPKTGTE